MHLSHSYQQSRTVTSGTSISTHSHHVTNEPYTCEQSPDHQREHPPPHQYSTLTQSWGGASDKTGAYSNMQHKTPFGHYFKSYLIWFTIYKHIHVSQLRKLLTGNIRLNLPSKKYIKIWTFVHETTFSIAQEMAVYISLMIPFTL